LLGSDQHLSSPITLKDAIRFSIHTRVSSG
jgi:hypothetical protein